MTLSIGIDIGGTKIAGGLVDSGGTIVRRARRDTPAQEPDAIVAATVELIDELGAAARAGGVEAPKVGVACAGYIDKQGANVLFAPNIAWRHEPLRARLEEATGHAVVIENDANAAAYGEFLHGGGADVDDMVMVTLGTGVGGGIVLDGELMRGSHGIAAEIGHMRVVPGGHLCGCGNRGCFEVYASGSALVREARELVASGAPEAARLREACAGDPEALRGAHVTAAAQEGDAAALALLSEIGRWVGEGCASLAAVLDPAVFVIGGGLAEAGDLVLGSARIHFADELTGGGHRPSPRFVVAQLGNDAGVIGAAALAERGRA